ncbi:MAG: N-succinylarginine dihydrolase [Endozoicomonadaceae bacterium]|nr:N-succinylarginine dihydrolase [Endozoicomonadaceae bacterium]
MKAWEVNFDALVEPVYNFAGLSFGNLTSLKHAK